MNKVTLGHIRHGSEAKDMCDMKYSPKHLRNAVHDSEN